MTDFITVSAGGPSPDSDLPDGVYPVILTALSDPKTVTARRGPKAGQEIDLIEWTFAVDSPGHALDARELSESTSTASGPRSKMHAYLTALFGGTPPPAGTRLTKEQLIGRRALATVTHDEGGWLRIGNLGALPTSLPAATAPAAPAVPVAVPAAVETTGATQLPFWRRLQGSSVMDALAFELPEPSASEYDRWFTLGSWDTEEASASVLDEWIGQTGMFRIHHEVRGSLVQPRAGQKGDRIRIDRILMPTPELVGLGGKHGAIGIEIKRSGVNIGPPLAQAMDYLRGSWLLSGGTLIQVSGVFLWPMHSQGGPLASIMAHNRIGSAGFTRTMALHFAYGEEVVFSDGSYGGFQVRNRPVAGTKVGSR